MSISAAGLGSGLDIQGLVSQLVAAERQPLERRILSSENKITSDISALGTFKSALSDLRTATTTLSEEALFSQRSVTSSSASKVSVTATGTPVLSTYNIEVSGLAAAQSLAVRDQFSSKTEAVGLGTLTFTRGTTGYTAHATNNANDTYDSFLAKAGVASTTITIDSTNNSLAGIRDAINDADFGVSAAILNEGSSFRLLLSSDSQGVENGFSIDVSDSGDSNNNDANGLSRLAFNSSAGTTNVFQTIAASDASFKVNGLALTSSSNTVTTALDGLSLTLAATTTSAVTVAVSDNSVAIKSAVDTFVDGYNEFVAIAKELTAYDAEAGVKGDLLGDFTARTVLNQLRTTLSSAAQGYIGTYSHLAEIGITVTSTGTLAVDDTKLSAALTSNFSDVNAVLTRFAKPSSGSGLDARSFNDTVPNGTYTVAVSSLATSGKLAATVPSAGFPITIDSSNDSFVVTVDGTVSGTVTLSNQAYANLAAVATEIQTKINADTILRDAGKALTVSVSGDDIEIRSNSLGSASAVALVNAGSDTTVNALGLALATTTSGTDLVGTIDGVAGVAAGNVLSGAVGSNAAGMAIDVSSTAGGSIVLSNGVANQFFDLLDTVLGQDNPIDSRISNLNSRATKLSEEKVQMERRLAAIEKRYKLQFGALDALLAELTTTGDFLSQQLKNIPVPGASKK
jgi:flagellar hook-associated protein 2